MNIEPYSGAVAVTPSDETILSSTRALYIGGAGNVAVVTDDRTTSVLFTAVPVGTILPVQVNQVLATNTTATAILALY